MKARIIQTAIIIAMVGAFMYFSLRSAGAQYGNPNDPYLDYQRQQREIEDLEIQRRQLEIQEMRQIWLWTAPVPQIVDPWDPAFQAEPL
jgi:hypothetical protein